MDGTPYKIVKQVYIDSIGIVSIDMLDDYCKNSNPVTIYGLQEHISGKGEFLYSGTPSAFIKSGSTGTFKPDKESVGVYNLAYTYTSSVNDFGCKKTVTKQVSVNPVPVANFWFFVIFSG